MKEKNMVKKTGMVIVGATLVVAHYLLGLAFAAVSDDTLCLQCPEEEYLTIETWYPSPWNSYDELRSNRIVVGGGDAEKDPLPPPWGTIAFKPLSSAPANSSDGTVSKGTMYFDDNSSKFKYSPDGSSWENLGGGEIKLVQYDFSTSQPACNSSNIGLMVFDNSSNRPYVCDKNGAWLTSSWTDKDMVMTLHSSTQCSSAGGTVVADGSGNKFCRFNSGSCPSGWLKYDNWTTTQSVTYWYCSGGDYTDSTGGHSWSNSPVETKTFTHRCGSYNRCECQASASASITQIGCY